MSGTTSIREAIARFEDAEYKRRTMEMTEEAKAEAPRVVASEEARVLLIGMLPPIVKMDKDITTLVNCEHLALSTNAIEKIGPGLKELKKLKVLSLGRNAIRKIEQLDIPHLEQLWLSYNKIDKLTGLDKLKSLKVLYMSNNLISSWTEIDRLANQCPELIEVLFKNNPIHNNAPSEKEYRCMILQRLPRLTKLDGVPVDPEEKEEAERGR
ncbi:dynein light chain, putative [Trypanosoma equiperdum]|uniref:Dynein axonemal light chain 1 n=4 Tax=Trypanozoon TaxID=39700 RepID=Q385K0_TRYB2|nr:dynein light chain, putative [Trypanosoma brucei gambiense DAL972]XP_828643.1 dynein light chain, putative [Trypanosoma brucei brucei TREU927]RHW67010.1 dynein light chain [Trypanosoma brucei equiperdum]SCU66343.1 dynein light chain, putative [Trypanosoma equiperdum]EAN79531.1 dynein light chain, putative [Trypanosoma brucei brucei TREU927]CBH17522.1 dynein light chain, putative [Trypanosoma brucei gambiense DAL972]|eukprot:XP_011779786.1 dynein light chain, putative [Trypanosoma brucei gambiense DAL972]